MWPAASAFGHDVLHGRDVGDAGGAAGVGVETVMVRSGSRRARRWHGAPGADEQDAHYPPIGAGGRWRGAPVRLE